MLTLFTLHCSVFLRAKLTFLDVSFQATLVQLVLCEKGNVMNCLVLLKLVIKRRALQLLEVGHVSGWLLLLCNLKKVLIPFIIDDLHSLAIW